MGQRLGTPISGNLINCTGYVVTVNGITGLGTGVATFLGTPSSANLRAALTDETGTGAAVFANSPTLVTPALGTPSSGDLSNCTGITLSKLTNSLSGNVALNNTSNYFDGPSVAQGSTGTWLAIGTVTVTDTFGAANIDAKLWDGTTVIGSTRVSISTVNYFVTISLSGYITSPAGNIRISCKDNASNSGLIVFNATGNSKDSTLTVIRTA